MKKVSKMDKPCDFCSKDVRYCDVLGTCDFIPKYNLCPICKELTAVHEPRCNKCGYVFKKPESEER